MGNQRTREQEGRLAGVRPPDSVVIQDSFGRREMEYRVPDRNLFAKAARIALDVGTFGAAPLIRYVLRNTADKDRSGGAAMPIHVVEDIKEGGFPLDD